ncbi:MAG: hypothetical protein ACK53Y_20485, partial [bacterium]
PPDCAPSTDDSPNVDNDPRQKNNGAIFSNKRRVMFIIGLCVWLFYRKKYRFYHMKETFALQ